MDNSNQRELSYVVIRLVLLFESLLLGFGLLVLTGVIPAWGVWHSSSPHYAAQISALLHGKLALSDSPWDCAFDLAWSEGGVQQVWGLGIPIARLPWTVLARLCGFKLFPDYLAFGLEFAIVAFVVLTVLVEPELINGRKPNVLRGLGSAAILLAFPPLVRMFKTDFGIYEEAIACGYLYAVLELMLLLLFLRAPTTPRWLTLSIVAGLGPLVRPPLVFYGISTWVVATLAMVWNQFCRSGLPWRAAAVLRSKAWLGGFLFFSLGIGILLVTNFMRFGSPLEFGHKLNLQDIWGSLYATRFDHPMQDVPFWMAAKELFGALFFMEPKGESVFFAVEMFWGQAPVARMRHIDFSVYDWTYIPWIIAASLTAMPPLWNSLRKHVSSEHFACAGIALWAFLSLIPITLFYLRTPALASRYLVDFGAGIAALIVALWFSVTRLVGRNRWIGILALLAWFAWQLFQVACTPGRAGGISCEAKELAGRRNLQMPQPGASANKPGNSGIAYDGSGWNETDGRLKCHVIVFVEDPAFLELDLAVAPNATAKPHPDWIRAKIGLEFLERDWVRETQQGWRVRFRAPQQKRYRRGIQPAFIATVPKEMLGDEDSPWILRRIEWRNGVQ